ncbi:ORF952 [White spot syndrome virus]|uniref:ORF952 n=1 Tax=White spot syndrome virus TaxID=342409 RepID=A0A2D3I6E6_9VIRU|nr:ORF952 [White spot syndrome virus]
MTHGSCRHIIVIGNTGHGHQLTECFLLVDIIEVISDILCLDNMARQSKLSSQLRLLFVYQASEFVQERAKNSI